MILLDTNICIYFVNEDKEYHPRILDKLTKYPRNSVFLSNATVAELYYGAENSQLQEFNYRLFNRFISKFQIIPFDKAQAQHYAKIRHILKNQNRKIGDMDIIIASCAMANNFTLVTNNEKDFVYIDGLKVENWAKK